MWKYKNTPEVYLVMSPIHMVTVALVLRFSMGRLLPQFRVAFDPSFITINGSYGDITPPSYWQSMCGFIKGKKSLSVNSEQHDTSPTYIST